MGKEVALFFLGDVGERELQGLREVGGGVEEAVVGVAVLVGYVVGEDDA